jgi:hypothetical protein
MAKAKDKPTPMYVATDTFAMQAADGTSHTVHRGQLVPAGDPRLAAGYWRAATGDDLAGQALAPGDHRAVWW